MSATQRSQPHSSPSTHRAGMSQCPRPVTLPALWPKWKRLAVRRLTRVAGLDLIYQLLDCCNPDGLRKNLVRVHRDNLAFCNESELLANMKKLAVRTENAMLAREILSKMRQDRDEPVLIALDLRGRREFVNSPPGVGVQTALTTTHALEWIRAKLWYGTRLFWAAPITT